MKCTQNVPISRLTTFKSTGHVKQVIEVESLQELQHTISRYPDAVVLGNGSNSLIADGEAVIIKIAKGFTSLQVVSNALAYLPASCHITQAIRFCCEHDIAGLEFAAGIPASIGGMVAMNFGCWGTQMSDVVIRVEIVTRSGEHQWVTNTEARFAYRTSRFLDDKDIIIGTECELRAAPAEDTKREVKEIMATRRDKQPITADTFGSIFQNPPGDHAARLIESVGLKGHQIGQAQLSEHHANFMINLGGATVDDALALIAHVRDVVHANHGIWLQPEVQYRP